MQAILRRTARVQARAVKKSAKRRRMKDTQTKFENKQDRNAYWLTVKKIEDEALAEAKLDWRLGPLAPKRQLDPTYGTVPQRLLNLPNPTDPNVGKPLPLDTPKLMQMFFPGDRVVIIYGVNAGKIAKVRSVDEKAGTVTLEDSNKAYVEFDEGMKTFIREEAFPDGGKIEELPIPQYQLRLVHHMNGQDVVVDKMLITVNSKNKRRPGLQRRIPGTREDLDVHRKRDRLKEELEKKRKSLDSRKGEKHEDPPEYLAADTYRIETDKVSWLPTMEEPPMPPSIIDELRNKYSKFRTRHSDEFVSKMLSLDEKQVVRQQTSQLMLKTPVKEIYRIQKEAVKEVESKKELTDESLSMLGEYMAKHMEISGKRDIGRTGNPFKSSRIEGVPVKTKSQPQPEARV